MLDLKIEKTELFDKLIKKLKKRYRTIEEDIDDYLESLEQTSQLGTPLGKNLYKVRIKNSDSSKGKSGGYRLITFLKMTNKTLTLVYIYSKSDIQNITENELDKIILNSFKE